MKIPITILSVIASLGGISGISIIIFRLFGNKIIEDKFERSLELFKYRMNTKFDRVSKIHEKEFEILPIIWANIITTNSEMFSLTSLVQHLPDLNRMNEVERKEVYDIKEFKQSDRNKIETSSDKLNEYTKIDYYYKSDKIIIAYSEYLKYYQLNRIFINDKIKEDVEKVTKYFVQILSIMKIANLADKIDYNQILKAKDKQDELGQIIDRLGDNIKERLHFNEVD